MKRVVVVGSGAAGTGAALAATLAGAEVTVIAGGAGASVLSPGAIDESPWESSPAATTRVDAKAREVLRAMESYTLPDGGVLLATTAGIVRPARGAELGLLDLASIASATVAVPKIEHPSWDGPALARAWSSAPAAKKASVSFTAFAVQVTRLRDEHALPDADLAARHDDPARLEWLAEQLEAALQRVGLRPAAMILPPWLGIERARAPALSARLGFPCGEALTGPGSPSGLRFERARDRALSAARVTVAVGWAKRVEAASSGFRVELYEGEVVSGDAVVLATGGLVGGGLAYTPGGSVLAAAIPPSARPLVSMTLEAPFIVGAHARPLELPGSLFGSAPETHAWPFAADPLLERAGVLVDDTGHAIRGHAIAGQPTQGPHGLFAAGEVVADRARTWLESFASGVRAGTAAAG